MCGNGIRCLGKLVFDRSLVDRTEIRVDTRSGVKTLSLHVEGGSVDSVTVGMGPARFARGALPMTGDPDEPFVGEPFEVDGRSYKATALSMGNPHLVLFVEEDPTTSTSIGSARWSNTTSASPSARTSSSSPSRATA